MMDQRIYWRYLWILLATLLVIDGAMAFEKDSKEMTTLRKAMLASLGLALFLFLTLIMTMVSRWLHANTRCCRRFCNVPCWKKWCRCCIRCAICCHDCYQRRKSKYREKKNKKVTQKLKAAGAATTVVQIGDTHSATCATANAIAPVYDDQPSKAKQVPKNPTKPKRACVIL